MALPPKEEREDGFEVLAFHRGKWTHVKWCNRMQQFSLGYGAGFILETSSRVFAELPVKPIGADGFYDW